MIKCVTCLRHTMKGLKMKTLLSRKSSDGSTKKDKAAPPPPPNTAKPLPNPVPQPTRQSEPASPPPIVVVSADTVERTDLQGNPQPARQSPLNRLRPGPKDTIPLAGKPPRKQRSSRFVVTEKVEIERLPPFMGKLTDSFTNSLSLQQKRRQQNGPSSS